MILKLREGKKAELNVEVRSDKSWNRKLLLV
jgi:hypothetical protein